MVPQKKKKNKKTELPHDPAIPLLGMYPKGLKADSSRYLIIAASFTIAKGINNPNVHRQMTG